MPADTIRYAHVTNEGVVAEIVVIPYELRTVAQKPGTRLVFDVPEDVQEGWTYQDGVWSA